MKYTQANWGRIFVIRLEDGDIVHEAIEGFARENDIKAASLIAVGGADRGSRIVVGPESSRAFPVNPMQHILDDTHEIAGTGTLFPDDTGEMILHMHMACGRNDATITGCIREGVKVWHVMEIILFELTDCTATRKTDAATGFKLLMPE